MWTRIKNFFLDLLFPVYCLGCNQKKSFICQKCIDKIPLCSPGFYHGKSYSLDKLLIAVNYHHPLIKKAIHRFKYFPYIHSLAKNLAALLIKLVKNSPQTISYLSKNNFVLIPVPLASRKLAQRGFNQAEALAKELSQKFNWPLNAKLLKKTKNTRSQTKLNYKERKRNIKNVFTVLDTECPKNIILVDDIFTTGVTLQETAKTLRRAGAKKIWAIVLAKS